MTTFVATRGGSNKPAVASGPAQEKQTAWGTIEITTLPVAADIYQMCKLPRGAIVLGGKLYGDKMASGTSFGSQCFTLNIGFNVGATIVNSGTAVSSTSTSNAIGTLLLEATTQPLKSEVGYNQDLGGLLVTDGPFSVADDCIVSAIVVGAPGSGSFSSGTLTIAVDYYMGVHA